LVRQLSVGILIIGNEILEGVILDTNSNWLVTRLKAFALHAKELMTVRDEVPEISKSIRRMVEDQCELVFTLGGLGPTHDDKTLRGVAAAFDLPLRLNSEALRIVEKQYKTLHKKGVIETSEITEARKKMAFLPIGAKPLDNRVGTAPGVLLERGETTVICLPGVPVELRWIFDNEVSEMLRGKARGIIEEQIIYAPSRDESSLSPVIDRVMAKFPGVYIKSMVHVPEEGAHSIRLWVSAYGDTKEEVENRLSKVLEELKKETSKQTRKVL